MDKKIIIIDGNSLLHRAYHGMRPLTNKDGEYTHGIYGFLRMLENLIKEEKPDGLGVAFDIGRTFRHDMCDTYKAGRKETDVELKSQFPLLKEALRYMGIPVLEAEGFEADDILGTVGKIGSDNKDNIILVTGDKDAFQLINDYTTLYLTRKGLSEIEKLTPDKLYEDYGFTPKQAIDIKGLQGDSSDNIKGVMGIGAKTALKLIKEYGSIEGIYENIEDLKGKVKENLIKYKDDALFSRQLGTIHQEVPIDYNHLEFSLEKLGDKDKLIELFKRLEFNNVFKDQVAIEKEELAYKACDYCYGHIEFIEAFNRIHKEKIIMDIKIDNQDIVGVEVFDGEKHLLYEVDFINPSITKSILEAVINKKSEIVFFDTKSIYHLLLNNDKDIYGVDFEDLSLLAYVIYPERKFTRENVVKEFIGSDGDEKFYCQHLYIILDLLTNKAVEEGVFSVYQEIEKPLSPILAKMEYHGVGIDRDYLKKMEKDIMAKITILTNNIWEIAGDNFNINSTQQLGKVLFETLQLPTGKKTKTGYSTNQEVLEKLADKHEIIPQILEYRKLSKLYSTYIEGLLNITQDKNTIHTTYNQTVAVTGRLSSENPNLQNIPVRLAEGKLIRKAFIPIIKGNVFLCADYSQIELRILAHMSGDEGMISAFKSGQDIHRKTASEVFGVKYDEVDSEMRRAAKAVNFGIVYGLSDFGLSRDLNIPMSEAKDYIEKYFERYPKIRSWIDKTILEAKNTLKVYTLTGRYRLLTDLKSSQYQVRAAAERMAMNAPIQGTAADMIKLAMIKVDSRLRKEKLESKVVLQVHDELILEVIPKELETIKSLIRLEMSCAMDLDVPLVVDLKVGGNWFTVEEV
ncbi:MAG: DNA polymerase I [Firmicutes bacterium]|nr:DNA polymerase I [Bacillota bacterium]